MLDITDVDLRENIICVRRSKGGKGRYVPLGKIALLYIQEYISEVRKYLLSIEDMGQPALFLNKHGKRLYCGSINRMIREYSRKDGMYHITTHKLRHAFALHMLRQGCDIRYIQEILGHEDLCTTQIYTTIYDGDLREKVDRYHPLEGGVHINDEQIRRLREI